MSKLSRRLSRVLLPVLTGFVLAAPSMPARADTPAMSYLAGVTTGISTTPQTLGWQFITNAPLTVDALGYFDFGSDGLNGPHQVGIWDNSGSLLASATVDAGTTDPIVGPAADNGSFRYQAIAPLNLPAGQTFTIGGTAFNPDSIDAWQAELLPLIADPLITIPDSGVFVNTASNTLAEPTISGGVNAFAGPNFLLGSGPSPVPEPGSLALLLTGALPLALFRRRRIG